MTQRPNLAKASELRDQLTYTVPKKRHLEEVQLNQSPYWLVTLNIRSAKTTRGLGLSSSFAKSLPIPAFLLLLNITSQRAGISFSCRTILGAESHTLYAVSQESSVRAVATTNTNKGLCLPLRLRPPALLLIPASTGVRIQPLLFPGYASTITLRSSHHFDNLFLQQLIMLSFRGPYLLHVEQTPPMRSICSLTHKCRRNRTSSVCRNTTHASRRSRRMPMPTAIDPSLAAIRLLT